MPIVTHSHAFKSSKSSTMQSHPSILIPINCFEHPPSMPGASNLAPRRCCSSRTPIQLNMHIASLHTARRRASCHLALHLVKQNQLNEVDHPMGGPPCQSDNTILRECPHTRRLGASSPTQGPLCKSGGKEAHHPLVRPQNDGSLILEFKDFAPAMDG